MLVIFKTINYMRKIYLAFALTFSALFSFSQPAYKPGYNELKAYEGIYEFVNHSTLAIAVSPKDTLLYAIVNKSNYPLTPFAKDIFLNMAKEKVQFIRDRSDQVAGYITGKDTFKLLDKNVKFPATMWYPRILKSENANLYSVPENLNDGLQTGNVANSGLDTALLREMMKKIIDGVYPNVHSILIIKDGKLVFEEYFYEYDKDSLQELRSATKSFVSALTGIAIEKGFIKSVNETVLPFFPEYTIQNNSDAKKQITIENLLTNQSGLDCDISNDKSVGNETKMDYSDDWVRFTLDLPMIDKPGGKGMYCSGNPVTLGRIIEKTTHTPLPEFARENLFTPLGITHFKWNFKPEKINAEDYCQLYLTPREMAKFGLLYLQNGSWNGRQIVDRAWVKQSLEKHSVVQGVDYGYLWWIKYLNADGVKYYGKGAQGNGGQRIYIWQEQNMVTVLTGGNYNTQSPSDELIRKYILPAFNKK
jgi:CubicO group peptidase (beta-lactamase class C family)